MLIAFLFTLGTSCNENNRNSPHLWANVFHHNSYAYNLTRKCLGLHFGRFFHSLIWSHWSGCARTRGYAPTHFLKNRPPDALDNNLALSEDMSPPGPILRNRCSLDRQSGEDFASEGPPDCTVIRLDSCPATGWSGLPDVVFSSHNLGKFGRGLAMEDVGIFYCDL
jgi:hypothetical protein